MERAGAVIDLGEAIGRRFPPEVKNVFDVVARLGDEKKIGVALVGGVVRDLLLDRASGDADIMLEHPAKPVVTQLSQILNADLISHERFFTFTLTLPSKTKIDIVTAREEIYAAPAKLPDVTPSTIERDLKRRDFTINAIACRLNQGKHGQVLDPFGGQKDLQAKLVRALHDKSFSDDPTRLFRAARFAGRLGFQVETHTEAWVLQSIKQGTAALLTPVRRRHEFEMLLREPNPVPAFEILKKWDALRIIHPDAASGGPKGGRFASAPVLVDRLAEWFGPAGSEKAQAIMTDLAFEKSMKAKVLSKLVQSPSTS